MKLRTTRILFISAILTLLLTAACLHAEQRRATVVSGSGDRTGMGLTVYNADLALVSDTRGVSLPKGTVELQLRDVAALLIPESVRLRALDGETGQIEVLGQRFEQDLLSPDRLIEKYVGREVRIHRTNPATGKEEITAARILSDNGGIVLETGDGITFGFEGRYVFPSVPEGLVTSPTLAVLLAVPGRAALSMEASYLTSGIGWKADYVLNIPGDGPEADISGWATITNMSGATYEDASLRLVAGNINRTAAPYPVTMKSFESARAGLSAQAAVTPAADYHMYRIGRRTTIGDKQTVQVRMLEAEGIPIRREYVLRAEPRFFHEMRGGPEEMNAGVFVEADNTGANGLGVPLPAGTVRIYRTEEDGAMTFLGEDSVGHTAEDETVRLKVGEAFDIPATRTQTDWRRLSKDSYEVAFDIAIRNRKDKDVLVKVMEPLPGDWKIVESSARYRKTDSNTAEFEVGVPSGSRETLSYRARINH